MWNRTGRRTTALRWSCDLQHNTITGSTLLTAECFLRLWRCELIFIWDFVADTVLGQIVDWFYGQIVGFLGNFFSEMGNMGAELFAMSWVQSVVLFFSYLGWALFAIGLVVACFECGVEYSGGHGNVKETALNAMKGFLAVSLFTQVPVRLYVLAVSLQADLTAGITGFGATSIGDAAKAALEDFNAVESLTSSGQIILRGFGPVTSGLMVIFCLALMAYAVIKVFFANLKRGGILLIQIAVGSLYIIPIVKKEPESREPKPFALPEAYLNMRRLYAYLTTHRRIDRDVVTEFVREKLLYEDALHHNCVFVGLDENGEARHAHLRSTSSQGKVFRINVEGSEAKHSFHKDGTDCSLYVFEAPIDLLSHITLYPAGWLEHSYVACCGTSVQPVLERLRQNPKLNMVYLCLDNDEAGEDACENMMEVLEEMDVDVERLRPQGKDWNDDLCAKRGGHG